MVCLLHAPFAQHASVCACGLHNSVNKQRMLSSTTYHPSVLLGNVVAMGQHLLCILSTWAAFAGGGRKGECYMLHVTPHYILHVVPLATFIIETFPQSDTHKRCVITWWLLQACVPVDSQLK